MEDISLNKNIVDREYERNYRKCHEKKRNEARSHDNSYTEVIILDSPPAFPRQTTVKPLKNTRIIELDDMRSTMALRNELSLDENNSNITLSNEIRNIIRATTTSDLHCDKLLPKLPAGTTILVKQRDNNMEESPAREIQRKIERCFKNSSPVDKTRMKTKQEKSQSRSIKRDYADESSRRKLFTAKKRRNRGAALNKKQRRSSSGPSMTTRSVSKKLYNVGAIYQPPTLKDESEWREWPVHGMHERPVYHPTVGLAVECNNQYFISVDGQSYEKIPDCLNVERAVSSRISRETSKQQQKRVHSFESCMHDSLHSVLGFSVQVMNPELKKLLSKKCSNPREKSNLTVVPEQSKPPTGLKCIKNDGKLDQVLKRGFKGVLIFLKTTGTSVKKDNRVSGSSINPKSRVTPAMRTSAGKHFTPNEMKEEKSQAGPSHSVGSDDKKNTEIKDRGLLDEDFIKELIKDTALLYCAAVGIHQDTLVDYINDLDPNECSNWLLNNL